jgi:Protein of unknown function (DUF4240)
MDEKEFWRLIDFARMNASQDYNLSSLLVDTLAKYPKEQIISYALIFNNLMLEVDHWAVIAAEKIIEGSVTDDPFVYFRCWLISQGEQMFRETIKNPDYLADFVD